VNLFKHAQAINPPALPTGLPAFGMAGRHGLRLSFIKIKKRAITYGFRSFHFIN